MLRRHDGQAGGHGLEDGEAELLLEAATDVGTSRGDASRPSRARATASSRLTSALATMAEQDDPIAEAGVSSGRARRSGPARLPRRRTGWSRSPPTMTRLARARGLVSRAKASTTRAMPLTSCEPTDADDDGKAAAIGRQALDGALAGRPGRRRWSPAANGARGTIGLSGVHALGYDRCGAAGRLPRSIPDQVARARRGRSGRGKRTSSRASSARGAPRAPTRNQSAATGILRREGRCGRACLALGSRDGDVRVRGQREDGGDAAARVPRRMRPGCPGRPCAGGRHPVVPDASSADRMPRSAATSEGQAPAKVAPSPSSRAPTLEAVAARARLVRSRVAAGIPAAPRPMVMTSGCALGRQAGPSRGSSVATPPASPVPAREASAVQDGGEVDLGDLQAISRVWVRRGPRLRSRCMCSRRAHGLADAVAHCRPADDDARQRLAPRRSMNARWPHLAPAVTSRASVARRSSVMAGDRPGHQANVSVR